MAFRTPVITALCTAVFCYAEPPTAAHLPPAVSSAFHRISPDSLKGHLSFIASDLLEGRDTPSRGLDIAAEYIAAQFRRAGLQPIPGTNSYFQSAHWKYKTVPASAITMTFERGGERIQFDGTRFTILNPQARDIRDAVVYKASLENPGRLNHLPEGSLEGKVVLLTAPAPSQMAKHAHRLRDLERQVERLRAAATLIVRKGSAGGGVHGQLIDPEDSRAPRQERDSGILAVYSNELASAFESLPEGEAAAKVSLHIPEPSESPVELKNVIGILPGSDPKLKDTYLLVTAHYDHIGTTAPEDGDGIYNGANDDGSGTVSVIEIASAMASMEQRPRRTVVFMTVFGEEQGLLGDYYYARHPIFPLEKTIADINLEHMGRTDDSEGPHANSLWMTGFDYSNILDVFTAAGMLTGVEIQKHEGNSDAFFSRSDNAAYAESGIPAHTFCAVFLFPDYHGLGDEWRKIDYDNMARLDRTVLAAVWTLAERSEVPHWNDRNAKTDRYREARQSEGNKVNP
ncbi:MAG: M28 family peptidase [Bryobacterales bacterium]|nr:M28 family peptidase [Bryobacterales bacterium]